MSALFARRERTKHCSHYIPDQPNDVWGRGVLEKEPHGYDDELLGGGS